MSPLMRNYVAGLLAHASDITCFLAPYINSYKRFVAGTFAPTKAIWSVDNRTAGFRLCGAGGKGIRIECRIGGADLNPYLAFAALIAAGLDGIERQLALPAAVDDDLFAMSPAALQARGIALLPRHLDEALDALAADSVLCTALGETLTTQFLALKRDEHAQHARHVSDWELTRYAAMF